MNKKIIAVLVIVALVAGAVAFYLANPDFLQDNVSKKIKVETVKKGLEKKVNKEVVKKIKTPGPSVRKGPKDGKKATKVIKKTKGEDLVKIKTEKSTTIDGTKVNPAADEAANVPTTGSSGPEEESLPTI